MLKEGVWQCAGTLANASNHCKYKAKEKRNLVSHIQQEHLADKVDNIPFCLSLLGFVSPVSLRGSQVTSVQSQTVGQFPSVSTTSISTFMMFMGCSILLGN